MIQLVTVFMMVGRMAVILIILSVCVTEKCACVGKFWYVCTTKARNDRQNTEHI